MESIVEFALYTWVAVSILAVLVQLVRIVRYRRSNAAKAEAAQRTGVSEDAAESTVRMPATIDLERPNPAPAAAEPESMVDDDRTVAAAPSAAKARSSSGPTEPPTPRYPYILLTGRGTASQWHTQTRTAKSPVLRSLYPQGMYVEINPRDARREGIRPNAMTTVASQRGSVAAKAFVTPTIAAGQLFIPMHYEAANQLTLAHFDPYSRQPSYKNCAVRITPAE